MTALSWSASVVIASTQYCVPTAYGRLPRVASTRSHKLHFRAHCYYHIVPFSRTSISLLQFRTRVLAKWDLQQKC